MKNKKNIIFIIITLLISIVIAYCIELFYFNRNVISKNYKDNLEIIKTKNFIQNKKYYETTSKDSYIIVKPKKEYINKLEFEYSFEKDYTWNIEYFNIDNKKINVEQASSFYIKKTTRQINDNVDYIKIRFNDKGIKIKNIIVNNKIYINYSRILFFVIMFFVIIMIIKFRIYFTNNLEKAFLIIAISVGLLMIFVNSKTVYLSWDDQIHINNAHALFDSKTTKYSNAFQILNSYNTKVDLFQSREEKIRFYKYLNKIHYETKDRVIQLNDYSHKYNRIVYFPFWIGFKIADTFNINFIGGFILAKLLNFICYVLLMYFAIKISTYAKKIIFIISLLISNMFLATQFSYDPMITASITFGLAIFLKMLEEKNLNYKNVMLFVCFIVWGSLPKAIYSPLLLLLLFVPTKKFKDKKQAIITKMIVCGITLVLMSTFILPALSGGLGNGDSRGGNTNATEQLTFILHNPIIYCKILISFLLKNASKIFIGPSVLATAGYVLNLPEDTISLQYLISFILLLYYTFITPVDKKIISNKMKVVFGICYSSIWLLITTALYLDFTVVGSNNVEGVQPRYFIPLLLLLLMILKPNIKKSSKENNIVNKNDLFLLVITFSTLMYTILMIIIKNISI